MKLFLELPDALKELDDALQDSIGRDCNIPIFEQLIEYGAAMVRLISILYLFVCIYLCVSLFICYSRHQICSIWL